MNALAITIRELRDRSRLFLICAALAVVPFIAAAMPAARPDRPAVVAAVSSFLALTLALGSAIALGASTVARDLVERRLSFYFSKPVGAASIWFGKAAAAIVASFTCFAIIAVPSLLVSWRVWPMLWMMTRGQLVAITAAGVIVLFFVSHVLASMIRSRSALIAIDFVLALLVAGAVVLLARPLLAGAAVELSGAVASSVAFVTLIVAAVAPVGQLARGRTDIRRSHAALSLFLWPPIFAVLAVAAVYVLWVISAGPADVQAVLNLDQPPQGERAFVFGATRRRGDYHAAFLVDDGGTWKKLGAAPWSQVAFSRDGRVAAWLGPAGFFPRVEAELHTDRGPANIRTRVFAEMVLSDDGSRVALIDGRLVTVYELATGRLLMSAGGFDGALQHSMFFVGNDLLRVIENGYRRASPLRIFELDIPRKKLAMTGAASLPEGDAVMASPDGSRLLLRKLRRVIDGRTAETVLQLPPSESPAVAVLDSGCVVDVQQDGKSSVLRICGGSGVRLPVGVASVAGELPGGMLLVSGAKHRGWSSTGTDRAMFVVDVEQGRIVKTIPGVKGPQSRWWAADPRLVVFGGKRLAGVDRNGKVVWWTAR